MLVQSLLKKVDQRITLNQALKHPWFLQGSQKQSKLRRLCSSVQFLHVHFHDEFNNNIKNAISKEEGEQNESKRLFKSIKSITSNTFDLEDSDDE